MSKGDMPQAISCYLCGSENITLYYQGHEPSAEEHKTAFLITDSDYQTYPDIYRCNDCSMIFSDPNAETASSLPFYRDLVDPDYHKEAQGRAIPFNRILEELRIMGKQGKLLDVGAATGIFLDRARKFSWEISGVEPSHWAVEEAKKRYDINVFAGTLQEATFADNEFNAVVMLDVIEHVSNPIALLHEVKRVLSDDGILVLTTPNIGSTVARFLGNNWWHIRRAHQFYFNQYTVKRLVSSAGFKIYNKKYYPWAFSLHYWFSRFENFNKPAYKLLSKFEQTSLGHKLSTKIIKMNFFDSFELYLSPK